MIDLNAVQTWLANIDTTKFINEDDVETKLVIPLFEYLGYPSTHRRGKYPINAYNTDRSSRGRKPEIDQVYFSTDDINNQNGDTCLVIVEAKKTSEIELTSAIQQAKFYAAHINPVLIVVTNGIEVIVMDNRKLRQTDEIFRCSIDSLKVNKELDSLCNLLRFSHVMKLNEDISNEITHKEYIELERILRNHPGIRGRLNKSDFDETISQNGLELIVSKPKVKIECILPTTYKGGNCKITFSSIFLRDLLINIDHEIIVGNLMQGLGTSPHWKTRHFLDKQDNGYFTAKLGDTVVNLSEIEVFDLCFCIDDICTRYKNRIISNENTLISWDYPIKRVYFYGPRDFIDGYHILSVDTWLWKLMHSFSIKYSIFNSENNTDWHIFWDTDMIIRVHTNHLDNVVLYPDDKNSTIDIIYEDISDHFFEEAGNWIRSVGPAGYWTLPYTEDWIINKFIPKVLEEYRGEYEDDGNLLKYSIQKDSFIRREDLILVDNLTNLISYIDSINEWIIVCSETYIDSRILISYYKYFSQLSRYANKSIVSLDYLQAKLYLPSKYRYDNIGYRSKTYDDIVIDLQKHAERISTIEYEHKDDADMMTRVFKSILFSVDGGYPQSLFNELKNALAPLWELARFELRHVYPLRSSRI
jgi:hypothetical protein